jgi:hypothetical protein
VANRPHIRVGQYFAQCKIASNHCLNIGCRAVVGIVLSSLQFVPHFASASGPNARVNGGELLGDEVTKVVGRLKSNRRVGAPLLQRMKASAQQGVIGGFVDACGGAQGRRALEQN